jgi:hypothetical protein
MSGDRYPGCDGDECAWGWLFLIGVALWSFLSLCSCGEATGIRRQAAADAIAGVEAITDAGQEVVAEGAKIHVETAVGAKRAELPAPTRTPQAIKDAPDAYATDAKKLQADADAAGSFWAWAGGGLLAILGVLRFVPGAHQPIVSVVRKLLENRVDRQTREREEGLAQAARTMAQVIEQCGLPEVKQGVAKKLPSGAKDALDAYLREMDRG